MNTIPLSPHDRDAERALLGGLLRDPDVLPDVLAVARPESMYVDAHRRVFAALADLAGRGEPVELVGLSAELKRRNELDEVGGYAYLADLWVETPTGANATYHAKLVRDAALLRGVIHAANEILRDAYSPTMSADELVAAAGRKFDALGDAASGPGPEPCRADQLVREAIEALDGRIASGAALSGLSCGFDDLDTFTGGLRPGELIVLGARPSLGKTALALNLAERVADAGAPVLFFSLEMRQAEIADRLLSMESGVPMHRLGRPRELRRGDIDDLHTASLAFGAKPLYVEDAPDQTAARVAAVARRACRRRGVRLIAVDYLQLMRPEDPRANRTQQVGTLALRMKQMARLLEVPVVLLSQLSRESDHAKRRPGLADLRESGDIEAHADRVLLLHREPGLSSEDAVWPIEVIVAKNRNGPTGDVRLNYRRPVLRFENATVEV